MSPKKAPPAKVPPFTLEPEDDPGPWGVWRAEYRPKRYRVLFASGTVVDLIATYLDSDLRLALLDAVEPLGSIEGVTVVDD